MLNTDARALMRDTARNPQFRRRSTDPPDNWKRERRPGRNGTALEHKSNFSKRENNHTSRVGQAQRATA
jgi:hypothetical protein